MPPPLSATSLYPPGPGVGAAMQRFRTTYVTQCEELGTDPLPSVLMFLENERGPIEACLASRRAALLSTGEFARSGGTRAAEEAGGASFSTGDRSQVHAHTHHTYSNGAAGDGDDVPAEDNEHHLRFDDPRDSSCVRIALHAPSCSLKAAVSLSAPLATDTVFTRVDFSDGFLGDAGCASLCGALMTNSTVTELNLRGCNIRADGARALAELVSGPRCSLRVLNLEWNSVGVIDDGIEALAEGLSRNTSVVSLDLRNNRIGPRGAVALARALGGAACLQPIPGAKVPQQPSSSLSASGLSSISGSPGNTSLRALDLRWNACGDTGAIALAHALAAQLARAGPGLLSLRYAGNGCSEASTAELEDALSAHRTRAREIDAARRAGVARDASLRERLAEVTAELAGRVEGAEADRKRAEEADRRAEEAEADARRAIAGAAEGQRAAEADAAVLRETIQRDAAEHARAMAERESVLAAAAARADTAEAALRRAKEDAAQEERRLAERVGALEAETDALRGSLQDARTEAASATSEARLHSEAADRAREDLRRAEDRAEEQRASLEARIAAAEAAHAAEVTSLRARVEMLSTELESRSEDLREASEARAAAEGEAATATEEAREARERLGEERRASAACAERLEACERRLDAARADADARVEALRADADSRVDAVRSEADRVSERTAADAEARIARAEGERDAAERRAERDRDEASKRAEDERARTDERIEALRRSLEEERERRSEAEAVRARLEADLARLEGEIRGRDAAAQRRKDGDRRRQKILSEGLASVVREAFATDGDDDGD